MYNVGQWIGISTNPGAGVQKVLIVEDDAANRLLLTQLLEDDFDVSEAADGASGVFAAIDDPPALILLDLSMPRLGGWAVVEMLQEDDRTKDIPVLIVSGHADATLRLRAAESGCAGFISKPYNGDEVLALVHKITGS